MRIQVKVERFFEYEPSEVKKGGDVECDMIKAFVRGFAMKAAEKLIPVKEFAGRPVNLEVLRQFGLVDNEKVDHFLASAFAKAQVSPESDKPGPQTEPHKIVSKVPSTNQSEQNH